jgi:TonB-dependent SusC/RagA subfamily outer membrane receptor
MKRYYILFIVLSVIFYTPLAGQKSGKKIIISGTVTDTNLKPVAGAAIFIDKKATDFATDEKGRYKIKVSPKAAVIAVFKNFNGVSEAEIGGRTTIDFILKPAPAGKVEKTANKEDEELYNIGYGTRKKKDMTTQSAKIDVTKNKYAAYQNIYDLLAGEIPGVQVTGKNIQIQGPSSLNLSTEPLLVVDGIVVSSIDDISPRIVKSVEVLKGAAASIYGSRGSNGVILINLKGAKDR